MGIVWWECLVGGRTWRGRVLWLVPFHLPGAWSMNTGSQGLGGVDEAGLSVTQRRFQSFQEDK